MKIYCETKKLTRKNNGIARFNVTRVSVFLLPRNSRSVKSGSSLLHETIHEKVSAAPFLIVISRRFMGSIKSQGEVDLPSECFSSPRTCAEPQNVRTILLPNFIASASQTSASPTVYAKDPFKLVEFFFCIRSSPDSQLIHSTAHKKLFLRSRLAESLGSVAYSEDRAARVNL